MIGRINVQVFLFTNNPIFRVLILQRIPERNSYWQPVSGGIEKGEKPIDTLKREIREETGIKKIKKIIDLDYIFTYETMWHGKLTMMKDMCFAAEINRIKEIRLSNEHQDYKWCSEIEAKSFLKWEHNLIALNKLVASLKLVLQ